MNDYSFLRQALAHVSAINITPFDESNGDIRWEALAANVSFLVERGAKVVVPCGNTGEFYALTLNEAMSVTRQVVNVVNRGAVTIAGIGYSTQTAIELGRQAAEDGADAVLIHQPIHPYITDRGAVAYYKKIIEALPIPSVIYFRDPNLTDEVLIELADTDKLIGVKYAINDLPRFARTVHRLREKGITWVCGTAEKWAPFFFAAGATGFTSGLVNVSPERSLALLHALQMHDDEEIWRLWNEIVAFEDLRAKYHHGNNVVVVKEAMNQLGFKAGITREPVAALDREDQHAVRELLKRWGLIS